ncbi:MAG: TolC family protein [Flavobacteriales bacterium]|nr:TolC family protein [Flavobacteriales bacterium]
METLKRVLIALFLWPAALLAQDGSTSFTLNEAIEYAKINSYALRDSEFEIQKAKRLVKEALAIGLPQISGSASYNNYLEVPIQQIPGDFIPGGQPGDLIEVQFQPEQNMGFDVTANQLIFDGSYIVATKSVKVFLELSEKLKTKTEYEITNAIIQLYAQVLVSEENYNVLEESAENLRTTLDETKALNTEGFVSEQDVDQLELLVLSTENRVRQADRQKSISQNILLYTMGLPLETDLALTTPLEDIVDIAGEETLVGDFDFTEHIDYQLAENQLRTDELKMKNEQAAYMPSLSAFYSYQQNSQANEFNFFNDGVWFPTQLLGVRLNVPIFTSFGIKNAVAQAQINVEQSSMNVERVGRDIQVQVQQARDVYYQALDNYQTTEQNLELSRRINDKELIKYREGVSTSLDLAQAQRQFLDSQSNFIMSTYNLIDAKSNLLKALNRY